MDNLSNKEKHFRDILAGQSYTVDSDVVWDNILDRLPPEQTSRRFPLFPIFGFGLIILGSAFYFMTGSDNVLPQVTGDIVPSKIIESTNQNIHVDSDIASINNNQNSNNQTTNNLKSTNTLDKKVKTENTNQQGTIVQKPAAQNLTETSRDNQNNSNPKTSTIQQSAGTNEDGQSQINKPVSAANNNFAKAQIESSNTKFNKNLVEENEVVVETPNRLNQSFVQYDQITGFDKLSGLVQGIDYNNVVTASADQFTKPVTKNIWIPFLSLRVGTNISRSSVVSNSLEDASDAVLEDHSKETDLYGATFNAIAGIENTKGWKLFGGFGFSQQVSSFEGQVDISQVITVEGAETIYIDNEGQALSLIGDVNQQTTKSSLVKWHRTHTIYNINVGVGKEIYSNNKFSFSPEVGLSCAINSQHKGYFFDEEIGAAKLNLSDEKPYKNNGILNATVGLNLEYNAGPVSISIIPNFRYNLNGYTTSDNFYRLDNSQFGIQLGATHRLF